MGARRISGTQPELQVATEATEIFGAYGSMPDSPGMHLMRDAYITQIDAGTKEGIAVARSLPKGRSHLPPRPPADPLWDRNSRHSPSAQLNQVMNQVSECGGRSEYVATYIHIEPIGSIWQRSISQP